jgi:hypothetical protein
MVNEDWLEFMSRRGEALVRRLAPTPTPLLPAAARQYTDTNLFALGSPEAGAPPGVDPLLAREPTVARPRMRWISAVPMASQRPRRPQRAATLLTKEQVERGNIVESLTRSTSAGRERWRGR